MDANHFPTVFLHKPVRGESFLGVTVTHTHPQPPNHITFALNSQLLTKRLYNLQVNLALARFCSGQGRFQSRPQTPASPGRASPRYDRPRSRPASEHAVKRKTKRQASYFTCTGMESWTTLGRSLAEESLRAFGRDGCGITTNSSVTPPSLHTLLSQFLDGFVRIIFGTNGPRAVRPDVTT